MLRFALCAVKYPKGTNDRKYYCFAGKHLSRAVVVLALCQVACVASVSSRGSSRKLGQERNKKSTFFCVRSNFRAITRLETLIAAQAICQVERLMLLLNYTTDKPNESIYFQKV